MRERTSAGSVPVFSLYRSCPPISNTPHLLWSMFLWWPIFVAPRPRSHYGMEKALHMKGRASDFFFVISPRVMHFPSSFQGYIGQEWVYAAVGGGRVLKQRLKHGKHQSPDEWTIWIFKIRAWQYWVRYQQLQYFCTLHICIHGASCLYIDSSHPSAICQLFSLVHVMHSDPPTPTLLPPSPLSQHLSNRSRNKHSRSGGLDGGGGGGGGSCASPGFRYIFSWLSKLHVRGWVNL